jgi:hypothetical protein
MPVVKFDFRLPIGSIKGNPDLTGKLRAAGFCFGGVWRIQVMRQEWFSLLAPISHRWDDFRDFIRWAKEKVFNVPSGLRKLAEDLCFGATASN